MSRQNSKTAEGKTALGLPKSSNWLRSDFGIDKLARKVLISKLALIRQGSIHLTDGEETYFFGNKDDTFPTVNIWIHRSAAYSKIAFGGSVGVGESYVDGDWDTSDLTGLVRLFVRNRETMNTIDSGLGTLAQPFLKLLHRLRNNEADQARKNIVAHYDLGNSFFALFLDPSWMYSAAIFRNEKDTLEQAQYEKNDRICRKLELKSSDRLVEIGTGWGSFAIHAAKNYGCHVTTTTISNQQFDLAKERIEKEGLTEKITLLKEDYRNLSGTYDALVSIEMIEAVGLEYLDTYFEKCSSLLKPGGKMMLQSILIRDQFFEQARKSVDFIQTHIFPGAAIPSVRRIMDSVESETNLKLENLKDFGGDYAKTLHCWAESLEKNEAEIPRLGYPDSLYRLWKFYFSYCEGGFLEKSISVGHFLFSKGENS